MKFTLKIWRQKDAVSKGGLKTYHVEGIDRDMSFLEMLDVLNAGLIEQRRGTGSVRPRLP